MKQLKCEVEKLKRKLKKITAVALIAIMLVSVLSCPAFALDKVGTNDATREMYENTYANLTERITKRGYAPTSLTGTYEGMFIRDSSIQVMAQNAYGDYKKSKNVLNYLLSYHQSLGAEYAQHIVPNFDDIEFNNTYLSQTGSGQTQNYYISQSFSDHALFGMKGPNNGGGVSFQVDSNELKSISVFTNSTGNDLLIGSLRTDIQDSSTEITNKEITVTKNGWQTFTFDEPISVTQGQTYYFFVQSNNGIAMFGKADSKPSDNAIMGYNYDVPVLGGFTESAYPAFKINAKDDSDDDNTFMSNTNHSIGLFKINATTHNSAFAFVPNTNNIRSFRVYLTGNAQVIFKITTEPGNESKTIKTINQTISKNGWQTVDLGENVKVTPNQKYYVHIATISGEIIAYGTTAFAGSVVSMNWENNVWSHTGYVIAAEVFADVNIGQKTYGQKLSLSGDAIQSISFTANAKKAEGNLIGELKESLDGPAVATGEVTIKQSGIQNYTVDFGREVNLNSNKSYYFVLKASGNDSVQWNYNPAKKASSYSMQDGFWSNHTFDFGLEILPEYSGDYRVALITIGNESVGVQEIPSLGQDITAVDVLIGKNNLEDGNAIATLYKGYGKNAIKIDETAIDITSLSSTGQMVHLEFGLSLEEVDKTQPYYLEIKAPQNSDNSITWYGTKTVDELETYQNALLVKGEAGFVAYKSNIRSLSNHVQIDGNYMLIHAWTQLVNGCKDNEENQEFIKKSYPIIKRFANYYLDHGYISDEYKLMRNDSFEHSREGRYWKSYDLITNVFASQALYELSLLAKDFSDDELSKKWLDASSILTAGINENLVTEVDDVKIYAELYDIDNNMKFVKGMSWVNWAPMAAQWYAMDTTIMQNTYDIYRKYNSQDYDGYQMLDVVYDFDSNQHGNHIIGKGLAWEIMFNKVKGDNDQLNYLSNFILDHSTIGGVYPETYQPNGHFSDVGNQEHASWQHYAMSFAYPELTKTNSLNHLDILIKEVQDMDMKLYTSESISQLSQVLENAVSGYNDEDITKEHCDQLYNNLLAAIDNLAYLDADYSEVDGLIAQVEKLNRDEYKDFSKVDEAIKNVVRGKNITEQNQVDAMANAIKEALDTLEKKSGVVIPIEPDISNKEISASQPPNTGDNNMLVLCSVLLLVSSIYLFLNYKKRRI